MAKAPRRRFTTAQLCRFFGHKPGDMTRRGFADLELKLRVVLALEAIAKALSNRRARR